MKKVFTQDDDGHWYLVPVDEIDEFDSFMEDYDDERDYGTEQYNRYMDYRIDGCPSHYSVENATPL